MYSFDMYKLKARPTREDNRRVARRHANYFNMTLIDTLFTSKDPTARDRATKALYQTPNSLPTSDPLEALGGHNPDAYLAEAEKELERVSAKGNSMNMEECVLRFPDAFNDVANSRAPAMCTAGISRPLPCLFIAGSR